MHALQNLLTTFRRVFMLRDAVRRRRRVQTAEAGLEGLESRQLLSVTNAFVSQGTLVIQSSNTATNVTVDQAGENIRIREAGSGHIRSFPAHSVEAISFEGGNGNDRFRNQTSRPASAFGGAGNDVLIGGSAADELDGGIGNDTIYGRGGDDMIQGGTGRDFIHGGAGHNVLLDRESLDRVFAAVDGVLNEELVDLPAGAQVAVKSAPSVVTTVTPVLENGYLVVRGTSNSDTINVTTSGNLITVAGKSFNSASVSAIVIVGESGDDNITVSESIQKMTIIFGGWGNDTVNGGGGTDYIHGSMGNDVLNGRGGNDSIWGGGGVNTMTGGTGTNSLFQRPANRVYTMNAFEMEIVRLTNLERTSRGLAALTVSAQIACAANQHVNQMASRSAVIGTTAAHNHNLWGVRLPTVTSRMDYSGFEYSVYRENIAFGYTSAAQVVAGWMNSPGHRANILSTDITHIGLSAVKNAAGTWFYCQNFAKAV
ncbi:MAG: CAP domain-containing protein [Planctomyces sp.]